MKHAFFQRKQDTDSGRRLNLVEPPRLEEIARPVRSEREIDRDILRNLRTLWNGASEKEIVQSLLSHESVVESSCDKILTYRKTWEKAFYFLLLQYRNKHLENFNPEPEQHRVSAGELIVPAERRLTLIAERRRRESSHKRSSRSTVPSDLRRPVQRTIPEGEGKNRTEGSRDRRHARDHQSPQATRPAPKSPAPPRVNGPRAAPSPVVAAASDIAGQGGDVQSRPVTPVHLVPGTATDATTVTPVDPRLPKILLQRPTPSPDVTAQPTTGLGFMIPAPPPSPSPQPQLTMTQYTTTSPHGSPPLGVNPIAVPQVQDAALQKFFHDIAEQLQLIGSASPRSSIAMESPLASPALTQGGSTAPATPIPTPEPSNAPILQSAQAMPIKPRPSVARANTDGASVGKEQNGQSQKRRSYLGDASARDNTISSRAPNPNRGSLQLTGDKTRRSVIVGKTDSKRKSKRESNR